MYFHHQKTKAEWPCRNATNLHAYEVNSSCAFSTLRINWSICTFRMDFIRTRLMQHDNKLHLLINTNLSLWCGWGGGIGASALPRASITCSMNLVFVEISGWYFLINFFNWLKSSICCYSIDYYYLSKIKVWTGRSSEIYHIRFKCLEVIDDLIYFIKDKLIVINLFQL